MPVIDVTLYNPVCDQCDAELSLQRKTPQECLAKAEFLGWAVDGDHLYCETCRSLDGQS